MAFEIVDGMTGTKHISSDDLSALNVATIGKADCVLKYGDDFKLTMESANRATLGTGVGMVGGKRFWNQAATNLTVQSGTQGQKRNDLVVARYAKTSAGIESITPVVVKGTPGTGTAADPATTSNDLKLWRIPLNGISVDTPVRLFDPVASLATLGDSVSQAVVTAPASGVTCVGIGRIVVVQLKNITLTGHTGRIVCQLPFRPVTEVIGCLNVGSVSGYVKIDTDGTVFCFSMTSGDFSGQAVVCI